MLIIERNYSFSVGRGHANWKYKDDWISGEVQTPYGTVLVYIQGNDKAVHATNIRINHKGQVHVRTYKYRYSTLYAVTLAKRFAKEIVGANDGAN